MKRFSEQFKKKSESIRLRATERADLRDRLVSYMEYHPLPQNLRTPKATPKKRVSAGLASEPFRAISIHMAYIRGFAGVFAIFLVVGIPFIAEQSVPGDVLYPVKTHITEEVRASLKLSPYAKVEWETQRLERRVAEARLLASEGKLTAETEAKVAQAVKNHTSAAQQEIAQIRENDADEAAIAEITFASALEVQSEVLEGHIAKIAMIATDETESQEGTSVRALASVVSEVAEDAEDAQEAATPSYEKLLGGIEAKTTYAYELFESVQSVASPTEVADIERRLADVERKVASVITDNETPMIEAVVADIPEVIVEETGTSSEEIATSTSEVVAEEVPEETPVVVSFEKPAEKIDRIATLRTALKDLQKLISFMTQIDVRETVTVEELVPVTLTDEERTTAVQKQYAQANTYLDTIVAITTKSNVDEKVTFALAQLKDTQRLLDAAIEAGAVTDAEKYAAEFLALAEDAHTHAVTFQVDDSVETVLEEVATTTEEIIEELEDSGLETESTEEIR